MFVQRIGIGVVSQVRLGGKLLIWCAAVDGSTKAGHASRPQSKPAKHRLPRLFKPPRAIRWLSGERAAIRIFPGGSEASERRVPDTGADNEMSLRGHQAAALGIGEQWNRNPA